MKRDGRTLAHNILEEMRVMAAQRMREGERPADVGAAFGINRTWAQKCQATARGRGKGIRALRSTKGTGRPRSLTPAQERQVFGWVNGKNPRQHGCDFGLWTRQIVRELVAKRFEVKLSLASIGGAARAAQSHPAKAVATGLPKRPRGHRALGQGNLSGHRASGQSGKGRGVLLG